MIDPHRDQPVYERGRSLDSAAAAVILLHGRGASAADILSISDDFDLPELAYLAPEAAGHSWYPQTFMSPIEQNQPWLDSALSFLGRIVKRLDEAGIPQQKVAFIGFSQGACLATEFVARNAARYGGLVALTGGLIGPAGTKFDYKPLLAETPVFMGSSDPDPHVPWGRVAESAAILSSLGARVTLKRYPGMPHTISQDEIEHARDILSHLIVDDLET